MTEKQDRAVRVVVTLASAAALSLISTPVEWWWFHFVVYLPMLWVLRAETPRANFWYGWLYGAFEMALIFRWLVGTITIFAGTPMPTLLGIVALLAFSVAFGFPAAVVWASVHPLRTRLGSGWILAHGALVILVDWLSSFLLLFPYQHGVTMYRTHALWQVVAVTGIWGPTFLMYFFNDAFGEAIYRRRENRPMAPAWPIAAVVTVVVVWLAGLWRYESVEARLATSPTLRIAQLQSSHGMEWRMQVATREEAFAEWMDMTRRIPPGSVDLVIWPEGACPYDLNVANSKAGKIIGDLARQGGFAMIIGAGAREREVGPDGKSRTKNFNTAYFVDADGKVAGRYDKMVPLPFGEYLPLGDYMPWLADMIPGIGDFEAGTVPTVFNTGTVKLAVPICYEAILGRVCRRYPDPDLIVNITNDAWFLDTAAPHQHAMLAAERAEELGIPLYRSAYTGVSMAVEPHGVIHSETAAFEDVARIVTLRMAKTPTLYAKLGDWFVALCGAGLAAALIAARRRAL